MTEEMMRKVKEAGSVDELLSFAREGGISLERAKAEEVYARFHKSGEIGDDDLDAVSGGACSEKQGGAAPKFTPGTVVEWNWSTMHCPADGSNSGEIISWRTADKAASLGSFYVYKGAVIYSVKCPKCGALMDVPEQWL